MYEELIKDLREWPRVCVEYTGSLDELHDKAADAIEELQADKTALNGTVANLLEQIKDLGKPKWIPVTERLPVGGNDSGAICENVSLLMDDGTVSCGWMNGITKKVYYLNARDDVVIKAPITRVTHWMPLPQPPKEEEEKRV